MSESIDPRSGSVIDLVSPTVSGASERSATRSTARTGVARRGSGAGGAAGPSMAPQGDVAGPSMAPRGIDYLLENSNDSSVRRGSLDSTASSSQFDDPITFERVRKRDGVLVNKAWYEPRGLHRWASTRGTVPHTRRQLAPSELQRIAEAAGVVVQRRNAGPPVKTPGLPRRTLQVKAPRKAAPLRMQAEPRRLPPAYFRRPTTRGGGGAGGGAVRYRYFKADSATRAYVWINRWVLLQPDRRIDDAILTTDPRRVDVSRDFMPNGAGHWEAVVSPARTTWRRPSNDSSWFVAVRGRLGNPYSHIWASHV